MAKKSVKSVVKKSAFTLVELMIVVAILGILAAIVLPEVQGYTQKAKEAAAKDNLRTLRIAIQRYAVDHNGVPPGYPNNDSTQTPGYLYVMTQLVIGEKYLSELPENPLNGHSAVYVVANNSTITDGMMEGTAQGWVYQPATKTIKINLTGTDSEGKSFFDY